MSEGMVAFLAGLAVIVVFAVVTSVYAWNTTSHDVRVVHGCVVDRTLRYFDNKVLHRSVVCP